MDVDRPVIGIEGNESIRRVLAGRVFSSIGPRDPDGIFRRPDVLAVRLEESGGLGWILGDPVAEELDRVDMDLSGLAGLVYPS